MATSNSSSSAQPMQDAPIFLATLIPTRSLKMWTIGVILSALAYGIEITLAFYCFQLLSKPSRQTTSRRTRRVLLFFITFMCLLGTSALVVNVNALINALTTPFQVFETFSYPVQQILLFAFTPVDLTLIVLATWASHGSMIWRCNALYADLPALKRILFLIVAALIVLTSFIFGTFSILTIIPFSKDNGETDRVGILISARLIAFELASLCTNVTISLLSAGRILYHLLYLRKIFGKGYTNVYERIVMILVESSSLTLLPDILLLAASASPTSRTDGKPNLIRDLIFAHQKLILHINIIAPILIIFRVAQGQTLPCNTQDSSKNVERGANEDKGGKISTLKFASGLKERDTDSFGSIESEDRFGDKEKNLGTEAPLTVSEDPVPLYLEYRWTRNRA